ncbi:aldo/keto reductase [Rhizobium sp. CF142]|uniref:aldo/keto reductase n=1 Tax=Rhizobium sp. CF142 TaxID=1144314 RepID=UPI00026EF448|nr:aldo/keto reductase [Rhizobium sp. CF142]EJJ29494.1 putative oxidoreductase, aryl-alcohol dehydrogenase like protein [Rhizobium sp. CF142]
MSRISIASETAPERSCVLGRRSLLKTGAAIAAASIVGRASFAGAAAAGPAVTGTRRLAGLTVSALGLGCQDFTGTFYATAPDRADMIKLVHNAADRGVTLFDAAEAYGPFEVERILGEAVRPFRNDIVLSSKFGWNIDLETGKSLGGLNSRPEHIKLAVEGMLKRLGTDRLDMVYQHRVDPAVPIEDVAGAVKDLVAQGKVLHYGLSEPGPKTVRRAHAVHPLTAIQNEYSILVRDPERDIIPLCEELGIGFVPWSPLGMGFLTGAINKDTRFAQGDFRAVVPRFASDNLAANMAIVSLVEDWARRKSARPAQIALAWLMAQKPWIVPIPGTTKAPHMEENLGAEAISFTGDELVELNSRIAAIPVQGARLPPAVLALSGVEAPPKS